MEKTTYITSVETIRWERAPTLRRAFKPLETRQLPSGAVMRVYPGNLNRIPMAYKYLADMIILEDGTIYKNRWGWAQ